MTKFTGQADLHRSRHSLSIAPLAAGLCLLFAGSAAHAGSFSSGAAWSGVSNVTLYGSAIRSTTLSLTPATGNQVGSAVLGDLDSGRAVQGFTATFDYNISGGNGADGFSFCFSSNPGGTFGESGTGSGLCLSFDTFDNGGTDYASEIEVLYNNVHIANSGVIGLRNVSATVTVTVNAAGSISVQNVNPSASFSASIPGWSPQSGWVFSWGARTGGAYDQHQIGSTTITATVATPTPTLSATSTPTRTPTSTSTSTPTHTPTHTPTPSRTPTSSGTQTPTQTPTHTPTATATHTPCNCPNGDDPCSVQQCADAPGLYFGFSGPDSMTISISAWSINGQSVDTTALALLNGAAVTDGTLLLTGNGTQRPTAWLQAVQGVSNGFDMEFQYDRSNTDFERRFAFVLQNSSAAAAALGTNGDYAGITNSLAIEITPLHFDNFYSQTFRVQTLYAAANQTSAAATVAAFSNQPAPAIDVLTMRIHYAPEGILTFDVSGLSPVTVNVDLTQLGLAPVMCRPFPVNRGVECRATGGFCDPAESCTGNTIACPADVKLGPDTECRASAGECDTAEVCNGVDAECPPDALRPDNTACADDGLACTADVCTGTSAACIHDVARAAGRACRTAINACDVAETCDGMSGNCPDDVLKDAGAVCRTAIGECDVAETCSAPGVECPPDAYRSMGAACGDASDTQCTNPDTCDGTGRCLRNDEAAGVACGDSSTTECTHADSCDGLGACSNNDVASGTICGDLEDGCSRRHCDSTATCSFSPGVECADRSPFGIAAVSGFAAPDLYDLDGDGDLDLVVGSDASDATPPGLYYFQNIGTPTSAGFAGAIVPALGVATAKRTAPALGDIDGDHGTDVLVGELGGDISLYSLQAGEQFTFLGVNQRGLEWMPASHPAIADVDGDGDNDVVVGSASGELALFRNLGNSQFVRTTLLASSCSIAAPALADIDADGDVDLFVGCNDGRLLFFEAAPTSPPSYAEGVANPFRLSSVGSALAPTLGDIDGDGDYDLFVGTRNGAVFFFENIGNRGAMLLRLRTTELDAVVGYVAKAPKILTAVNNLVKPYVLTIDDVTLNGDGDDPENFMALKTNAVLLAAATGDQTAPAASDRHYIHYALKRGKESVAAPGSDGRFAKPSKHIPRVWELSNGFGTISVESKKEIGLLIASAASTTGAVSTGPNESHFLCYKVKPHLSVTDQQPNGLLRSEMQVLAADLFNDCAHTANGGAVPFAETAAQGRCLDTLLSPLELCNPANLSNVEPPRVTTAAIAESTASATQSLLCYATVLATTVTDNQVARLTGVAAGSAIPAQAAHKARSTKTGSGLYTRPGSNVDSPLQIDTKKRKLVCLPTDILSVTPLP